MEFEDILWIPVTTSLVYIQRIYFRCVMARHRIQSGTNFKSRTNEKTPLPNFGVLRRMMQKDLDEEEAITFTEL